MVLLICSFLPKTNQCEKFAYWVWVPLIFLVTFSFKISIQYFNKKYFIQLRYTVQWVVVRSTCRL